MSCLIASINRNLLGFCFWLGIASAYVMGQNSSLSVLIAEFTGNDCESARSSLDTLLIELNDEPNSSGVVLFRGEDGDPIPIYRQQSIVERHLLFRQFDKTRIVFRYSLDQKQLRTELWKTDTKDFNPVGEVVEALSAFKLKRVTLVHRESWTDSIGCSYSFDLSVYSRMLYNHDRSIGRVVIHARTAKDFVTKRQRIVEMLKQRHKDVSSRVEFAFVESKRADIEYWLIPKDMLAEESER